MVCLREQVEWMPSWTCKEQYFIRRCVWASEQLAAPVPLNFFMAPAVQRRTPMLEDQKVIWAPIFANAVEGLIRRRVERKNPQIKPTRTHPSPTSRYPSLTPTTQSLLSAPPRAPPLVPPRPLPSAPPPGTLACASSRCPPSIPSSGAALVHPVAMTGGAAPACYWRSRPQDATCAAAPERHRRVRSTGHPASCRQDPELPAHTRQPLPRLESSTAPSQFPGHPGA
jgi:hypothetical protein